MDVNTLLLLLDVADAGSLAEASRRSGVPKSTISRKLRELEQELGVTLVQRTTRQLGLTDAGQRMVESAREVSEAVRRATNRVRATGETPKGHVSIAASVSLAERILAPIFVEFMSRYPEVVLDVVLDPSEADLIGDQIDVAIRIGTLDPRSPMIVRRFVETRLYPCAAPAYLEARGVPNEIDDLREHSGIFYRPGRQPMPFVLENEEGELRRVTPAARLIANSHILARDAVVGALGIGMLPTPFIADAIEAGTLVRVLKPYRSPPRWVYAVFPSRDLATAARAFVDFLAERIDPDLFVLG